MANEVKKRFISQDMTTDAELASVASLKVDKVAGKQLSTEDYTTAEKAQLAANTSTLATKVDKVAGKQLSTEDYTTAEKAQLAANTSTLATKVDKVAGKQLSTEDYTTAEKSKLAGVATGATANATDAQLRDRATHTGTILSTVVSDFAATVRATILTGLDLTSTALITASDGVLSALGKLQAQIIAKVYGNGFQYVEATANSTNNSTTTYVTKLTLTTPNLPLGTYIIEAAYLTSSSTQGRGASIRIMDGATQVLLDEMYYGNTAERPYKTIKAIVENVSGVRTITLQFKAGITSLTNAATITMGVSHLVIWRVL